VFGVNVHGHHRAASCHLRLLSPPGRSDVDPSIRWAGNAISFAGRRTGILTVPTAPVPYRHRSVSKIASRQHHCLPTAPAGTPGP
jgi:hypothetical protein